MPAELDFRFPEAPAPGEAREVAEGVLWLRLPLPFRLDHVNIYLIEDGAGFALLDTGIDNQPTREIWERLLAGLLNGRPLTRILSSHCHPDHIGLAGWLAGRLDLELYATKPNISTRWRSASIRGRSTPNPIAASTSATGSAPSRRTCC